MSKNNSRSSNNPAGGVGNERLRYFESRCGALVQTIREFVEIESPSDDVSGLRHKIFAERSTRVRESMAMSRTCRVEQQSRGFDCVSGDDDRTSALEVFFAFAIPDRNTQALKAIDESDDGIYDWMKSVNKKTLKMM